MSNVYFKWYSIFLRCWSFLQWSTKRFSIFVIKCRLIRLSTLQFIAYVYQMLFFTVPEPIYRLSSLKRLNMSHNCISELSNLTGKCIKFALSVHLTYTKPFRPSDNEDCSQHCILNYLFIIFRYMDSNGSAECLKEPIDNFTSKKRFFFILFKCVRRLMRGATDLEMGYQKNWEKNNRATWFVFQPALCKLTNLRKLYLNGGCNFCNLF